MAQEGIRGDLVLEPYRGEHSSRNLSLAYVFEPDGSRREIFPRLESSRVVRVREAMIIVGTEAVPRGRKDVERYRQTWVCSAAPIAAERWPDAPRVDILARSGFDPADDDFA